MASLRKIILLFFVVLSVSSVCAYATPWSTFKTTLSGSGAGGAWVPGDDVMISGGQVVEFDVASETIGELHIHDGIFKCDDGSQGSRTLTVNYIMVMGATGLFECGASDAQPFTGTFTVNFKESDSCIADPDGQPYRDYGNDPTKRRTDCQGLDVMNGGSLSLFGNKGHNTWTQMAATALPDATSIQVLDATGWSVGDSITIASSEANGIDGLFGQDLIQERTIIGKSGATLTLSSPLTRKVNGDGPYIYSTNNTLTYDYGDQYTSGTLAYRYAQKLKNSSGVDLVDQDGNLLLTRILSKQEQGQSINSLDERTEVANKTRNIRIIGDQAPAIKSQKRGVHLMFMQLPGDIPLGDIHIDGVEIVNGGRVGELARYPIHWHFAQNSEGDFVRNSSIYDSYNRCITIHQTQNVLLEKNVCVNSNGHAYFLEDGNETGNRLIDNISILTERPEIGEQLLHSDIVNYCCNQGGTGQVTGPAAYWISNPDNIYIGNSASSSGSGFWFSFKGPNHNVAGTPVPEQTLFSVFSGNRTHTTVGGVVVDYFPNGACMDNPRNPCLGATPDRTGDHDLVGPSGYAFHSNYGHIMVDNFTSYKATGFAQWIGGDGGVKSTNMILADSQTNIGMIFSQDITNSLIVGASPNLSAAEIGSALGFAVGALLYDGVEGFKNLHFAGYSDPAKFTFPFALFGAASQRPSHFATGITFEDTSSSLNLVDFAHNTSFKPRRRDNWTPGLYVRDGSSFGYYPSFADYSIRPDEETPTDAISTFFSTSPADNDCKTAAEWLTLTDRKITNASVCPGYFGYIDFLWSDALINRRTFNPNYPDILYDTNTTPLGWGTVGKIAFPDALIKANHQGQDPNNAQDLTYELVFQPGMFQGGDQDLGLPWIQNGGLASRLMKLNDWGPWLVLKAPAYKACVLDPLPGDCNNSQVANVITFVDNNGSSGLPHDLHVRAKSVAQDKFYGFGGDHDFYTCEISAVCGPDTDQDGVLNSTELDDDNDGINDDVDTDDDNDTVPDALDFLPDDPSEWVDTDGDGVGNTRDTDDDNDEMPDTWESTYALLPLTNDAASDADSDGLTNIQEYRSSTNPQNPNTDGDQDPDGFELYVGRNPSVSDYPADRDNDGETDADEILVGSNPFNYRDPVSIYMGEGSTCVVDNPGFTVGNYPANNFRCWNSVDGSAWLVPDLGFWNLVTNPLSLGIEGAYGELIPFRVPALMQDYFCINLFGGGNIGCLHKTIPDNALENIYTTSSVRDMKGGKNHICVLTTGGTVECFGDNTDGKTVLPALSSPSVVAVGSNNSCVIDSVGVHCRGNNTYGQNNIPGLSGPIGIAVGDYHVCALDAIGVRCWGRNDQGQLGFDNNGDHYVDGTAGARMVVSGSNHSCVLRSNYSVYCWGSNSVYQARVPAAMKTGTPKIVTLSAAGDRTCAARVVSPASALTAVDCWPVNIDDDGDNGTIMDSDGDGFSDAAEITASPVTDPQTNDTDRDGLKDGLDSSPADMLLPGYSALQTILASATENAYGYSVSDVGDVNNDGYDDVIVGSPQADSVNGVNSGVAYLYSGSDGSVLYTFNGPTAGSYLGYSVSGAGDVNNDGLPDVIIGNWGGFSAPGIAKVYSGANGSLLYTFNGSANADFFGFSVSGAGDVNNDGYADLIVGSFGAASNRGAVKVYSGQSGAVLYTFDGVNPGEEFGHSVSKAGDVNKDGYDDVVIGAYRANSDAGYVKIFSGVNGATLYTFSGAANDFMGEQVSDAGDINNDGYDDIAVVASGDDSNGFVMSSHAGFVQVYSGSNGSLLYTFESDDQYNLQGRSVSAAGDVNRDGYADVIVGDYGLNTTVGAVSGIARVYSGKEGAVLYTFGGSSAGAWFGYAVSGAGDINNDGFADLIVGAPWDVNGGAIDAGSVKIFSGATNFAYWDNDGDGILNGVDADDDNDTIPDVSDPFPVQTTNQAITVSTPAPATAVYNTGFNVAAMAATPVSITTSGVCTGSGAGSANITMTSGITSCTVNYSAAEDATYFAAAPVQNTTSAVKAAQSISFSAQVSPRSVSLPFAIDLPATASSGLTVEYGSSTATVCNVLGAVVTPVQGATGTCTLTANQPGDSNYASAVQQTQNITILAAGAMDVSFSPGTGANNNVNAVAVQSDGKVIVAGTFTTINGFAHNRLARLNADGSRDTSFNPNIANNAINAVAVQTDGKIVIVGTFTTVNTLTRNRIARLNADGTIDTGFNIGTGANNNVNTVVMQSDGKIVIGGTFTTINGVTHNRLARLNTDGTRDAAFTPNVSTAGSAVNAIAIQSDGKIVIGGTFTTITSLTRNRIARLNSNGTVDTFNPNIGNNAVNTVAIQSDGKIVVGGNFTTIAAQTRNRIARLNSDGTLEGLNPDISNNVVNTVAIQSDGEILVGGTFTTVGGQTRNRIARINENGTLDTTFNPNANNSVLTLGLQSDGRILLGGTFTSIVSTTRNRIAKIYP